MRNLRCSLHSLFILLAVFFTFFISNFLVSNSIFAQCNSAANDPSFNPNDLGFGQGDYINTNIMCQTPDDKLFIFGYLGVIPAGGVSIMNIMKVTQEGLVDSSFTLSNEIYLIPNVTDLKLQTDGKLLVAGDIRTTSFSVGINMIRLNMNGSVDNSFSAPSFINTHSSMIRKLAIQSDGKIIVGGTFQIDNQPVSIVRLNTDGSLDLSFNQGYLVSHSGTTVHPSVITIQNDGKILVGGNFKTYNGTDKEYIVRLNNDGSIDTSFNNGGLGVDASISSIRIQSDNKIVFGGAFTHYNNIVRNKIVRLNTDGSLDTSFGSDNLGFVTGAVDDLSIQQDGKIVVVGSFYNYNGNPAEAIVRVNPDGSWDNSFIQQNARVSNGNSKVAVLSNGKILANILGIGGGLKRLNSNGSRDVTQTESYGFNGYIKQTVRLSNGSMFVRGNIDKYQNTTTSYVSKLDSLGQLDTSFRITDGRISGVKSMAVQSDGKLLLVGDFRSTPQIPRGRIVRYNQDGSLDLSFDANAVISDAGMFPNGAINDLAVQNDGKVIIVGSFNVLSLNIQAIIRLNSDGSIDDTFNTTGIGNFYNLDRVYIQADGKILLSGRGVNNYNDTSVNSLFRVLPNGNIDNTFNCDLDMPNGVTEILELPNQDLVVSGHFNNNNSLVQLRKINKYGVAYPSFKVNIFHSTSSQVSDMELQNDGGILVAGHFDTVNGNSSNNIVKVNSDGTINTAFDVGVGTDEIVTSITTLVDNSVLLMGNFTSYNGTGRNRIVKITNSSISIINTTTPQNQYGLCTNTQTTLETDGTGTVYWYDSPTSNTPIHTGINFTTPVLTADSTYFYAQDSSLNCGSSDRLEFLVTTSQSLQAISKTNYTAYLDNTGNVELNATLLDSISVAACGDSIVSLLFDDTGLTTRSFSCADTNAVNVVLRVTDNNENVATSPTIIHVKDTIRPVVSVRVLPVIFNTSNQATISARDFITSLSDNCTDSVDINVVFDDTGLETKFFDCGNTSVESLNLRITDRAGNQTIQPVIINPSATSYDFNVNIISAPLRPAITSTITALVNNYSCAPKSGELKVTLPSDVTYVSSSITPNRTVGTNLFWDVTDLSFDRSFSVRIQVLPNDSLNIGDEVCFSGHVTPETNDLTRLNNLKQYCFPIVNSYDPNDKQVYPQGICDNKLTKRSDLPLTYTIRFQNTGNAPALKVNIVDSLSNLLDRSSLKVVESSHTMVVDTVANSNVITFRFDDINLPDSTSNLEGSQGYVIFELDEIRAHSDTSRIENKSYIYFDTNEPIITNTVKNTIVDTLPTVTITINQENSFDKTIKVSSSDSIVSVVWFKDGSEIASFNNQKTIQPTESGSYKAKVTYLSGCEFETEEKVFTFDIETGIEEESAKIFTVYPNPNTGSFKVEFATTTNQKTNLVVVDALGRTIYSKEISRNEKTTNITLPKISAGVYVVQIVSQGKVYTKQLVIQ